jgi:hypothetical protein
MTRKPSSPSTATPKTALRFRHRFRRLLKIIYEYHKERSDARNRAAAKAGKGGRKSQRVDEDDVDDGGMYGGYIPMTRNNLMGW